MNEFAAHTARVIRLSEKVNEETTYQVGPDVTTTSLRSTTESRRINKCHGINKCILMFTHR